MFVEYIFTIDKLSKETVGQATAQDLFVALGRARGFDDSVDGSLYLRGVFIET